MKNFKLLVIAIAAFAFASSAHAATVVSLYGDNYELGSVAVGQSGEIHTDPRYVSGKGGNATYQYAYVTGTLNPNMSIVFTYNTTGSFGPGAIVSESLLTDVFHIKAESEIKPMDTTGAVTVLANLSGPKKGLATITNLSASAVQFIAYALGGASFNGVYATYGANVPLPGAAILFGSGLLALVGAGRRKLIGR